MDSYSRTDDDTVAQPVANGLHAFMQIEHDVAAQRDLAYRLATATSLEEALPICLDIALRSQMDCGGVYLSDPASGDLHLAYTHGLSPAFIATARFVPAQSSRARIVHSGQSQYLDYGQDLPADQNITRENVRMVAVLPLMYQGRVVGCFNLASHRYAAAEISPAARSSLEGIAAQVGHVIVRLQAEAALRESQQQWEMLFNSLQDFVFMLDTDWRILQANAQVIRQLGYPKEEIIGQHISGIYPPELHLRVEMKLPALMAVIERNESYTHHLITRDGRRIPVETKLTRGRWDAQDVLFGVSRDVSERQQAEAALRESEMLFRTIFFEDRAVKLLIDPQTGMIVDANQAATDFYGYPYDHLTQMRIQEINQLPPETVSHEMQDAAKHDKNFFAFRHRLASGEIRNVDVYSNTIEIMHQTYLLSFIHDVTEGKQAIAALRESEARAQGQVHALEMLSTIITDISSILDSERLPILIVEHAKNLLKADAAKLITYDAMQGDLVSLVRTPAVPPGYCEELGDGALSHVARTRQSLILNDYAAWPGALSTEIALGLVATLNVPLLQGDRLVGVLGVGMTHQARAFTRDDERLLTLFAQQAAVAIVNAHLTARLQIDPLTGVHTHGRFFALGKDVVSAAAASGQPVGVAIFDMDHFKLVNDTYGHPVGDEVLRWVAAQCGALLPPEAVLGRIGGEEFTVILPGADELHTMAAMDAVRQHIARLPVPTRRGALMVTMSIGVAVLAHHHEMTLDQLLERADHALYQAKRGGRNRTCVSTPDHGVSAEDTRSALWVRSPQLRDTG